MQQNSQEELQFLSVTSIGAKLLLLFPVILALWIAWFAIRWDIGDTIAEYSPRLEDGGIGIARTSVRLAPDDPLTHWSVATVLKNTLDPDQLPESLKTFEQAVSLAPNDYRYWVDLGRARSQAGDLTGAEKALQQSVKLAPSYSSPRWYLGNIILREGRTDDGFAELRRAADSDPTLRPQIFNLASHIYGDDIEAIKGVVGGGADARSQLVTYLVTRNRLDDALRVWSSLSQSEKSAQKDSGDSLVKGLMTAHRYHDALGLISTTDPAFHDAEPGKVFNSGFESELSENSQGPFGWIVKSSPPHVQLALDQTVFHSGQRSLRAVFKSPNQLAYNNISQLAVVQPSSVYRLEYWIKTDSLKSVGTPLIEVADGATGAVIATSVAIHVGSSDWQSFKVDFKTGANTEAVTIRSNRATCGSDTAVCPIFGTVWYDDFTLERINAGSASTNQ